MSSNQKIKLKSKKFSLFNPRLHAFTVLEIEKQKIFTLLDKGKCIIQPLIFLVTNNNSAIVKKRNVILLKAHSVCAREDFSGFIVYSTRGKRKAAIIYA